MSASSSRHRADRHDVIRRPAARTAHAQRVGKELRASFMQRARALDAMAIAAFWDTLLS
jgi:hypothetical protein